MEQHDFIKIKEAYISMKDWVDTSGIHKYGETTTIKPESLLIISPKKNLRAIVKSKRKIKIEKDLIYGKKREPALFSNDNLISSDDGVYIFETNYRKNEKILSTRHLDNIPFEIKKSFLKEVPHQISKLAYELTGEEEDSLSILEKFYNFVREHIRPEYQTSGKSLEKLIEEYEKEKCFYGNCKEASDFYKALCNAKGFPTKSILGAGDGDNMHEWVDVFIPSKGGYKLLPVDPALRSFGKFDKRKHALIEISPSIANKVERFFSLNYKLNLKVEVV